MGRTISERLAAATARIEGFEAQVERNDEVASDLRAQARDYREQIRELGKEAVDLRARLAAAEKRAAKAEGYAEALLDRLHPPKPVVDFDTMSRAPW